MSEPNESNQDRGWKDWEHLWQQSPAIDVQTLARRVRRATLRLWLGMLVESLVVLFGVSAGVYLITRGDWPRIAFGLFVIAFSVWAMGATLLVRRGAWAAESETTTGLLDLQIRRTRAAIHYARLNIWAAPVGLMLILTGLWVIAERHGSWSAHQVLEAAQFYSLLLLWIIGVVIFMTIRRQRKLRELENLRHLRESLEQGSPAPQSQGES